MTLISDSITLYKREMLIFKANLRTNILRSVIFPLFIILIFGNIGQVFKNTPVAVVNYANNPQSRAFINDMQVNNYVQVTSLTDENTALNELATGTVDLVIIILPTYPSTSPNGPGIQLYYTNTQLTVISSLLPVINATANKASGLVPQNSNVPRISVLSSALYGSSAGYKDYLTAGILPMVIVFSGLFGGGMSLITDRQLGNLKSFFITPINKNAIILSRVLSGSTQGLIAAMIALGIGYGFGATIAMGPLGLVYLVVVALIISAGFSAVAIMLASRIKRVDAYAIFSQAIGLPLWFLSGGIEPIQSLPSWLSPFSIVDPLTYAGNINRDVMMQGFIPAGTLAFDLSILIIFSAALILVCMKMFKATIE
ncbi:MAG: ABC transporter permease [Candidatus Micrarchaeota archaeon]|nr:ABC transporter permease [Candidatus Micrarchaeota archaeon]